MIYNGCGHYVVKVGHFDLSGIVSEHWVYEREWHQGKNLMPKSNDEARADEKTGSRPPVHGNQNTINQPKPREQTELGRYPKRKSTDEY